MKLPFQRAEINAIIQDTIRVSGAHDCVIRLFVSRGPGGFTVNPYECPSSQLYVAVGRLQLPTDAEYARGVSIKSSGIPAKEPFFANVKSCNYLQNVLMKKEAVDAGVDYTIALDDHGFLAEGAAENFALLTRDWILKLPNFARILKGTTVSRAIELLNRPGSQGKVGGIVFEDITLGEAYSSEEILIFGTTFNVLAAVQFDGQLIGTGKPGPAFHLLHERFQEDVLKNPAMQTPVYRE